MSTSVGIWASNCPQRCVLETHPASRFDQLGVALDLPALTPAGQVGNGEAGGVKTDRPADGVGDALHHDLLLGVGELGVLLLAVPTDQRVSQLVDLGRDLGVGRELRRDDIDHDAEGAGVVVALGRTGDGLGRYRRTDRGAEVGERFEEIGEAIAS